VRGLSFCVAFLDPFPKPNLLKIHNIDIGVSDFEARLLIQLVRSNARRTTRQPNLRDAFQRSNVNQLVYHFRAEPLPPVSFVYDDVVQVSYALPMLFTM
jgi:hypothetical protein